MELRMMGMKKQTALIGLDVSIPKAYIVVGEPSRPNQNERRNHVEINVS